MITRICHGVGFRPALVCLVQRVCAACAELSATKRIEQVDIVIVEGYKREPIPKIEVFRTETGKPSLFPDDDRIIAVATDDQSSLPATTLPLLDLNDIDAISAHVCRLAGRDDLAEAS